VRAALFLTTAAVSVLIALGCTGGLMGEGVEEQEYERSDVSFGSLAPDEFRAMDLPYYGGQVEKGSDGFMEVSYGDEATVEQLVEWWPAALEAEGWTRTSGGPTPSGGFLGTYETPDGRRGSLSIHPTGSLWTVTLNVPPGG